MCRRKCCRWRPRGPDPWSCRSRKTAELPELRDSSSCPLLGLDGQQKDDYTTFPLANTLRRPGIPPRPLRRDRNSANRVPGDRLLDETRGLDVLGELAEILRARRP